MDLTIIIGTPVHSAVKSGIFGLKIISGVIIGIEFTHNKPKYCIGFGDNSVWVYNIAESKEELIELLKLPDLDVVKLEGSNHRIEL